MKINILDKNVFTKIAAGEVVERPASVIKELVENAIDAHATNISIEIAGGGITKMKVTDNGTGMEFDDLPRAFMPHATSKIANVDDLETIATLGFRGEALSSIASVAKVLVTSKQANCETGGKFVVYGGEVVTHEQTGCPNGTTVLVEDLFYCIPARAKFLKKPKREESEITNIVSRLILSHPHIAFKYVVNDKLVFLTQGQDLKEAIYVIYGKNTADNLLPVTYKRDYFKITGYVGKPTYNKPNRTYQTLLINNRYVVNQTVSTAVYKAYEGFLMKGNFPFFVLNLEVPLQHVDVNVHPNKLDVKFDESNRIFGLFLHAVSTVLFEHSHVKQLEQEDEMIAPAKATPSQTLQTQEGFDFATKQQEQNTATLEEAQKPAYMNNQSFEESKGMQALRKNLSYFLNAEDTMPQFVNQDGGLAQGMLEKASQNEQAQQVQNQTMFEMQAHKIVGILFHTYIVVESGEDAYFIDQHAAHERLLYDKFKAQLQNREIVVQQLLVPYILDVNYMESEFLNHNLQNFKEIGFEIENFGANTFKVNTVPVLFKDVSLHTFFAKVLEDINETLKISPANIIEGYLARSACRTAIKANDVIGEKEIEILLQQLNQKNQVLLCPHGRPVVVKVPKTDLEKWFKRIV